MIAAMGGLVEVVFAGSMGKNDAGWRAETGTGVEIRIVAAGEGAHTAAKVPGLLVGKRDET
jgi:hypothetical protein